MNQDQLKKSINRLQVDIDALFMKVNILRRENYDSKLNVSRLENNIDSFRGYITALIVINIFLLLFIIL